MADGAAPTARSIEALVVLAVSGTMVLLRPMTWDFGIDASMFLTDAAAFPASATVWDLCYPTPTFLFHGPLTALLLAPLTRIPGPPILHMALWASLVGVAPLFIWLGLRRAWPLAALPVALGFALSPAFSVGARCFTSPGFMPLFLALGFWPLMEGYLRGDYKRLMLAGVALGLAFGCHLSGVLLGPPLLAAAWNWRRDPRAFLGIAVYAVLFLAFLIPPAVVKADSGWFDWPWRSGITIADNYLLVLLLGGLVPMALLILLLRRLRPEPARAPWLERGIVQGLLHPALWIFLPGLALVIYLSIPPVWIFVHYWLPFVLGALLLLAPASRLERRATLGLLAVVLVAQLGVLMLSPLDDWHRYGPMRDAAQEICAGEAPPPDPYKDHERSMRVMVWWYCPETMPTPPKEEAVLQTRRER